MIDLHEAVVAVKALDAALERIHEQRESGEPVPNFDLQRLGELVENCATHPAFATNFPGDRR